METKHKIPSKSKRIFFAAALIICDVIIVNIVWLFSLAVLSDFDFGIVRTALLRQELKLAIPTTMVAILTFGVFSLYTSLWSFAGIIEVVNIFLANVVVTAIQIVLSRLLHTNELTASFFILGFILNCVAICGFRMVFRLSRHIAEIRNKDKRIMIIGAGRAGSMVLRELAQNEHSVGRVVCFIDDAPEKIGQRLNGIKVVGGDDKIVSAAQEYNVDEILIAIPSLTPDQKAAILAEVEKTKIPVRILPSLNQLSTGEVVTNQFRKVEITDLLEREPIQINMNGVCDAISGRKVLITGGGGSIGSELCRQVAAFGPRKLIIFDIYENNAYAIQQELRKKYPELNLEVLIGSVRDKNKLDDLFAKERPELVFHAAAHKHVPLMEDSPNEAVKNNVFGTKNVAMMCDKYSVQRMLLVSTDKAVNPTNVMGATKRICEMLVQYYNRHSKTDYVAVRFGNVLGSNGSVIPLFRSQIEAGGPVTVTDKNIIRFFMTIPEAVSLILETGTFAKGGEIFVLDMGKPVKIDDMARKMIRLSGYEPDVDIKIVYTGLRPGEKLYEELLMSEEGMSKTANDLIYIGNPIAFDEDALIKGLERLEMACLEETEDIRPIIGEIVPTYHPASWGGYGKIFREDLSL